MTQTPISRRRVLALATEDAGKIARTGPQSVRVLGRDVVLQDIIAPHQVGLGGGAAAGAAHFEKTLARLLSVGDFTLKTEAVDRWGRPTGPAFVRTPGGARVFVQEALVGLGAARVRPQSDDFRRVDRLLEAEAEARRDRIGLWGEGVFHVVDAGERLRRGDYAIVESEIVDVTQNRARLFINFGPDFRTDLTATVSARAFARWRGAGHALSLVGKRAQVRGWVAMINGPSIEIEHPRQLVLAPSA